MLTSSFLQHHNPAAQQQQWANLARMDDRTVAIKVGLSETSIDRLTTPPPPPLPAAFLLHLAVCDPTLPLFQPCSAKHANSRNRQRAMRMWTTRPVRSVLELVVVIGTGLCTYLSQCVTGRCFARYRSSPHPYVRRVQYNKSFVVVQASCTAAFVQKKMSLQCY